MKIPCRELTFGLLMTVVPGAAMADVFEMHYPMDGLAISDSRQAVEDDRKEALQVQADKAMCLGESSNTVRETRTRTLYHSEENIGNCTSKYIGTSADMTYVHGSYGSYQYKKDGSTFGRGGSQLRQGNYLYKKGSFQRDSRYSLVTCRISTVKTPYQESYYVDVEHETAKYDWCTSQGYPTQN